MLYRTSPVYHSGVKGLIAAPPNSEFFSAFVHPASSRRLVRDSRVSFKWARIATSQVSFSTSMEWEPWFFLFFVRPSLLSLSCIRVHFHRTRTLRPLCFFAFPFISCVLYVKMFIRSYRHFATGFFVYPSLAENSGEAKVHGLRPKASGSVVFNAPGVDYSA